MTGRDTGSVPERETGDPVPLADALARVRAELGLPDVDVFRVLFDKWEDIVGMDVAAHAHLHAIRDGVVTVVVDSPLWGTQLRYLETVLVARANQLLGDDPIRSVRVRIEPC